MYVQQFIVVHCALGFTVSDMHLIATIPRSYILGFRTIIIIPDTRMHAPIYTYLLRDFHRAIQSVLCVCVCVCVCVHACMRVCSLSLRPGIEIMYMAWDHFYKVQFLLFLMIMLSYSACHSVWNIKG